MNWNNLPPLSPSDEFNAKLDGIVDGLKPIDHDMTIAKVAIFLYSGLSPETKSSAEGEKFLTLVLRRLQYQAINTALNAAGKERQTLPKTIPTELILAAAESVYQELETKFHKELIVHTKKLLAVLSGPIAPGTSGQPQPPNPE